MLLKLFLFLGIMVTEVNWKQWKDQGSKFFRKQKWTKVMNCYQRHWIEARWSQFVLQPSSLRNQTEANSRRWRIFTLYQSPKYQVLSKKADSQKPPKKIFDACCSGHITCGERMNYGRLESIQDEMEVTPWELMQYGFYLGAGDVRMKVAIRQPGIDLKLFQMAEEKSKQSTFGGEWPLRNYFGVPTEKLNRTWRTSVKHSVMELEWNRMMWKLVTGTRGLSHTDRRPEWLISHLSMRPEEVALREDLKGQFNKIKVNDILWILLYFSLSVILLTVISV